MPVFNPNQQFQKLSVSAIPFIIAPTGTMANNGAITLGTALATTYANAYIFLPAGAIATSVPAAASWLFCQMSSTTVGTVFNNAYTTGVPTIPASPTAFATTGPGAYTGVTSAVTGPQITIPAGATGPNGVIEARVLASAANTAGNKTISIVLGATTFVSTVNASVASTQLISDIYARGSQASQVGFASANALGVGTATGAPIFGTENLALAKVWALGGTLATATDYLVLEAYQLEVISG
jgi:hypothetical protein